MSIFLLAACSGGEEKSGPEDTAQLSPLQKAERPAAEEAVDRDLPETAEPAPVQEKAESVGDGKAIPTAIQGRWALKAADCGAKRGTDLTALVIDAKSLAFFESHGELAHIRERSANRIVADYKFSGEGMDWDRLMQLTVTDNGKTLVRRDYGEGAGGEALRYTRCA